MDSWKAADALLSAHDRLYSGLAHPDTDEPPRQTTDVCFLSPLSRERTLRFREEFRTPIGVRKSPRNEPAVRRWYVWGFRRWAGLERLVPRGRLGAGGDYLLRCAVREADRRRAGGGE